MNPPTPFGLRRVKAEGAGVEPARAFARWFSKPLPCRSANPPKAGFEPTTSSSATSHSNPLSYRRDMGIIMEKLS